MTPRSARLALLAAAVGGLFAVPTGAAEVAPPPSPKCQPFDVLYLSEARPLVMRLRVATDGVPLEDAWERFADDLFARLDADGSGSLDDKEGAKLRPTLVLLTGRNVPSGDAGRPPATRDALAAYLRQNNLGPLRLPPAANPRNNRGELRRGGGATPDELDKAIMEHLDTNKDGKLSPAELAAAPVALRKLDTDENELISTDELLGRAVGSPFFVSDFDGRMVQAFPAVELLSLGRKPDGALARRLLGRYGPKPAGNANQNPNGIDPRFVRDGMPGPIESAARRLTPKDIKLGAEAFAALDQDGDGELDAEELARFGPAAVPDVDLVLRLGPPPAGRAPAEVLSAGEALKTRLGERGEDVALETPGVRLELIPAGLSADAAAAAFRARHLDRFRAFDRDGNGYLDVGEANGDFVFRDLFTFLDADRDGRVSEKELIAALDGLGGLAASAARGLAAADVTEAARGLFGLLDADGDGRLSVRELRAAPKLVARFDADGDGLLAPGEVPRRFRAALAHGLANVAVPRRNQFGGEVMAGTPRPPAGPLWFRKMDRNRDGDVSRREFLGTDEEFRKLDTDGDGLISLQEAEAAGAD
jgi:Ca2+-binding EF-hand superfamily protein